MEKPKNTIKFKKTNPRTHKCKDKTNKEDENVQLLLVGLTPKKGL